MMRHLIMTSVCVAALAGGLALVGGCDNSSSSTPAAPAAEKASANDPVVRENGVATVHITGDDQMQYDLKSFTVHPGEKVRIDLKNIGKMPKEAMSHNVVVLNKGIDYKKFANEAVQGGNFEDDYVPESMRGDVLAHTKMAGPGDEVSVEFTAPSETGNHSFVCTFPGHFITMHGTMKVK